MGTSRPGCMAPRAIERSLSLQPILRAQNKRLPHFRLRQTVPTTLYCPSIHSCHTHAGIVNKTPRDPGHNGMQKTYIRRIKNIGTAPRCVRLRHNAVPNRTKGGTTKGDGPHYPTWPLPRNSKGVRCSRHNHGKQSHLHTGYPDKSVHSPAQDPSQHPGSAPQNHASDSH